MEKSRQSLVATELDGLHEHREDLRDCVDSLKQNIRVVRTWLYLYFIILYICHL